MSCTHKMSELYACDSYLHKGITTILLLLKWDSFMGFFIWRKRTKKTQGHTSSSGVLGIFIPMDCFSEKNQEYNTYDVNQGHCECYM